MRIIAHSKFSNGSMSDWIDFYHSQSSRRSSFASDETLGIVNEKEAIFSWKVTDKTQLMAHGADPDIQAHVERMDETVTVYEAREIQDSDGPGQYFGIWTFENETPQEWINVWSGDDQRLSRNEVFAIVDDNTVAVLMEAIGTPEQHAAHLERPEVKEHIARINEKAQIWKADPMELD